MEKLHSHTHTKNWLEFVHPWLIIFSVAAHIYSPMFVYFSSLENGDYPVCHNTKNYQFHISPIENLNMWTVAYSCKYAHTPSPPPFPHSHAYKHTVMAISCLARCRSSGLLTAMRLRAYRLAWLDLALYTTAKPPGQRNHVHTHMWNLNWYRHGNVIHIQNEYKWTCKHFNQKPSKREKYHVGERKK